MQEIAAALGLQQDLCPCWGIIQAQNLSRGIGRRFRASEVLYEPPSRADAGLEKLEIVWVWIFWGFKVFRVGGHTEVPRMQREVPLSRASFKAHGLGFWIQCAVRHHLKLSSSALVKQQVEVRNLSLHSTKHRYFPTQRPQSNSFLGFIYRIL